MPLPRIAIALLLLLVVANGISWWRSWDAGIELDVTVMLAAGFGTWVYFVIGLRPTVTPSSSARGR